jgi:hypothetical protein
VNGISVVWGTAMPWSNNALTAFSVVWGSKNGTAVSAASVVWGSVVGNTDAAFTDAGDDEQ